ncbi:MAG: DUF3793 family protein [Lachnospiraceae bacterium]|nr:DUF3793 family protein [Lachnospiraceae bacterium]
MSITEIMEWSSTHDGEKRLMLMLGMHCAPMLCGSKISNIMTISKNDFAGIRALLQGTGISYRLLKSRGDRLILFLYREQAFRAYLSQDDICSFISEYGYDVSKKDTTAHLNHLAKRVFFYDNGEIAFPHEIGIFLGYPIEDVRGFVENNGQNYEYSGYWKVYDNVDSRKRLFARFEADRDFVVRSIIHGKTIREIAG